MKVKKLYKRGKNLDKLIAAVQAREILWNRDYRGHRNRYKLERYWNEVAVEMCSTSTDCRKRWKNLKDQCRKEMKKNIHSSDWPHFQKLSFIHHLFLVDDEEDDGNQQFVDSTEFNHLDDDDDSKRQRIGFTMRKKMNIVKKRSLQMDTDKLIELVRERDLIWNRQNKRHHHWHKLDSCWKEIAELLGVSRDEARIKWKYIRDTARKEYRKSDSDWEYLPKLQFLINQFNEYNEAAEDDYGLDYAEEDTTYYPVENEVKEDEFDEFDIKPVIMETDFYDEEDDPTPVAPEQSAVEEKEVVDSNKDEDVGFFNSLLPHVRKLNPAKKMMLRIKMQEMVYNTVYGT